MVVDVRWAQEALTRKDGEGSLDVARIFLAAPFPRNFANLGKNLPALIIDEANRLPR
jgi:hypothetical protein